MSDSLAHNDFDHLVAADQNMLPPEPKNYLKETLQGVSSILYREIEKLAYADGDIACRERMATHASELSAARTKIVNVIKGM